MKLSRTVLVVLAVLLFHVVPSSAAACCKICSAGKACGNSCISASYTCHQPPGCACNAGAGGNSGGGGSDSGNKGGSSRPPSSGRPSAPKTPKYTRTSGAILEPAAMISVESVLCGFVDGLYRPGRMLASGKFLLLKIEIRNVDYLEDFYTGAKSSDFAKIAKTLKARQKKQNPICRQLF